MGRVSFEMRQRLEQLKREYELSEKAARYVDVTLEEPAAPTLARARAAGYTEGSAISTGGKVLKTSKIVNAIKTETEKLAKAQQNIEEIKKDGRGWVKKTLALHAEDPEINPNQTRAVELIGKMEGAFIERIELDAGEHTRRRLAQDFLKED